MLTKVLLFLKLNLNKNNLWLDVLPAITIFIAVGITAAAHSRADKLLLELSKGVNVASLLWLIKAASIKPTDNNNNSR